jgi:glycosyltransferase involved in cell wall biosynthesis
VKLVKGSKNLGVGGGRQRLLEMSKSPWILFLDNDLVFNSKFYDSILTAINLGNFACLPFTEINKDGISQVRIPELYFSKNSYSQYQNFVGLGSSAKNLSKFDFPQKITGVAGGVFLANVNKLKELGGFRGPGKVGYEDLELSIRLHKAKCDIFLVPINKSLSHNKSLETESDRKSELTRLDPFELRANARFIEYTHNYAVWGINQYEWLTSRAISANVQLDLVDSLRSHSMEQNLINDRPSILLVCDSPGWALERIAVKQRDLLARNFDTVITFSNDWESLKAHLFSRKWSAVVFLWRAPLFQLVRENLVDEFLVKRIGYCVYDHQGDLGYGREVELLELMGVPVGVVNETLFRELRGSHKNLFLIPDGVDTNLFQPNNSCIKSEQSLTVGWSGNTKWGGIDDVKGYTEVIKPCINDLQNLSKNIKFDIIDSQEGKLPQAIVANSMQEWDVVICTSKHEGTPNPVLEGLALGIVVISTQVGMVRELNTAGAQIRIIERNSNNLSQELLGVLKYKQENRLEEEGVLNRRVAVAYDWVNVVPLHKLFFMEILKG